MKKGSVLTIILLIATAVFWMSIPPGCANIIPPQGGPRDTIPPRLVHSSPPDSSVNFRSGHVTLTFDEYVDLKDLQNNLLFTPTFANNPIIEAKARTLTIRFRDSLEKNTTYVMNFGNAIIDLTESNVLRNFVYTFSTGPRLDSLTISGHVTLAETGGTDTSLVAVLYRDRTDSAVQKSRPLYVVRLNGRGDFEFRNLPSDTFAVYVLGDIIGRRYLDKKQLFAFADRPVIAGKADSLKLYAYRELPANAAAAAVAGTQRIAANDRRLRFTPATTTQQDLLTDYLLNFPVPLRSFDSTKMHLSADSSFTPERFTTALDSTKKELRLRTSWKPQSNYHLILDKDFATDTSGRQLLKTDTLSFVTRKQGDYGSLSIRLRNVDLSAHPVLQFLQANQVVFSVPVPTGNFTQQFFLPGDYDLRILYDTNGNGKWDPGQFFGPRKRQPELVHPVTEKITVKPNWDNEFERKL